MKVLRGYKNLIWMGLSASCLALLTACVTTALTSLPDSPDLAAQHQPLSVGTLADKPMLGPATSVPAVHEIAGVPLASAVAGGENKLLSQAPEELERGHASWYHPRFQGRRTASGERYNKRAFTAAHRTLPFGTVVRVRSLLNGREVDVRINDRGPASKGRVIDLSQAAAESLGMKGLGVKEVLLLVPDVKSASAR